MSLTFRRGPKINKEKSMEQNHQSHRSWFLFNFSTYFIWKTLIYLEQSLNTIYKEHSGIEFMLYLISFYLALLVFFCDNYLFKIWSLRSFRFLNRTEIEICKLFGMVPWDLDNIYVANHSKGLASSNRFSYWIPWASNRMRWFLELDPHAKYENSTVTN